MNGDRHAAARVSGWHIAERRLLALELDRGVAELSIGDDGSVRLRARAGESLPPPFEAAIGRDPWQPVPLEPQSIPGGGVRIDHEGPRGAASVELDLGPFALRVIGRRGEVVARLDGLAFEPGGGGCIACEARPGERFFGFGEKRGSLDKRGTRLAMRNRDPELRGRDPLYVSIPFFLALLQDRREPRACGVLLDAFGPSHFDVAASHAERVRMETRFDGIDVTIFPGPSPADVMRRFSARVGRTPLPPRWALGHHQSRWSYASEAEVRRVAREIRARRIPGDAIWLDIDHMDGYRVFTWHPSRFPAPQPLISDLDKQGFRVVTIVDPGVKVDDAWSVYRDGCARDVFCRRADGTPFSLRVWPQDAALPDFNRESVRAWWGEQHRALLAAGVAGIWNDMNEPAGWERDVRIGRAIIPTRKQDFSQVVQRDPAEPERSVEHERVRNIYGLQECRATRDALEAAFPERRPFVLTRSGYAGVQRFAAVWTGDNASRWSHLRESVPMLLNLSLSGVAFCGADIGGFVGSCTPELYARWIQLGALYPFARTHSMWLGWRQEPWRFGRRVEAIARAALELRMRLLPYLYGLFREAEQTGAPVWRPLFYEFPEDAECAAIEDQFMLGPSLLVAPVVERGARERRVHLPPGRWMSWHDDSQHVGPRRVTVAAPLESLPMFLRAGAIVPTQSPIRHTRETPEEPCIFEVAPGDDGAATLVEDDGETTAYRRGAVATTSLRLWDRAGGRLRLEIGRRHGSHPVPARMARVTVRGCPPPLGVYLDGHRIEEHAEAPGYAAREGRLHVRFPDHGSGYSVEVDPSP